MQFNRQQFGFGGGKGGQAPAQNSGPAHGGGQFAGGPGPGAGGGRGGSNPNQALFAPKSFPWSGGQTNPQPANPGKVVDPDDEPTKRTYEVLDKVTVRATPQISAKMKTKKSRGARVWTAELTVNGWLKLESEAGYMVTDMRGAEGQGKVAEPADEAGYLVVPEYQPQGVCCMEVVHKNGAPVYETPSRKANQLSTRRVGEYVFPQSQNFDGWVHLASPEVGWMQVRDQKIGDILRLRKVRDVQLWSLSDMWAAARKTRKESFGTREVQTLKDLERKVIIAMGQHLSEVQETGSVDKIINEGLLKAEDLEDAASRVRCKLFANMLVKAVKEEATLRDLLPDFKLLEHPTPLPATEEEEEDIEAMYAEDWLPDSGGGEGGGGGGAGGLSAEELRNTQPFIFGDKVYRMAPNGILLDPPNEVPIGMWNRKTQEIEPAIGSVPGQDFTLLSYFGKQYYVMPDHTVVDPTTEEVVGILNEETGQIDAVEEPSPPTAKVSATMGAPRQASSSSPTGTDMSPEEAQQIMSDSVEQGEQMAEVGAFEEAALSFGAALDACRRCRSIDMEVECDILRKRAACWARTGRHKELLEDAEKLLSLSEEDKEAEEWRRMASFELMKGMKSESKAEAQGGYSASWKDPKVDESSGIIPTRKSDEDAPVKACAYCMVPVEKPSICSKCRSTYYCGRACQRNHWKVHKHECGKQPVEKAAPTAEDEDDGAGMEELD